MPTRVSHRRLMSFFAFVVLSACAPVGPNHQAPVMELPASFTQGGTKWKRQTTTTQPEPRAWWKLYHDATLTALVEQALEKNQELAASAARMRQARELSNAVRSRYFPDVTTGANVNRSYSRFPGSHGSMFIHQDNFIIPVDFSYEVDLWGKVRRQVESSKATAQAAGETLNALRLSVAGEVVQTYWALRAVDTDRMVLNKTLVIRRKALELLTKRRDAGNLSGLDLARAETEVATVEAERIQLDQQRVTLVNALAVLTGSMATGSSIAERPELPSPPTVPVSVPSEVLRQRPDIRAAERRVAAANADIGVATAAFYPSFAINSSSGLSSDTWNNLFRASSIIWTLGANAAAPVFQGHLLTSQKKAAIAAHEAASADYRQTVLDSIREVENALQGGAILERRQVAQDHALAAALKTFDLSFKRYESGLVSFLDVVDAERTRLDSERAANAVRAERLAVSVSLIKALGGEW